MYTVGFTKLTLSQTMFSGIGEKEMSVRDPKTAKIGEELLPLEVGYLPEFFRRKGEAELNYTPSVRENSLRKLKEALANDSSLSDLQLNDKFLLLFLNFRKYDLDRTVLQIKKYLKYKSSYIYMFTNIKVEELLPCMTPYVLTLLPWRCQDGCTIALSKYGNWNAEKHPLVPLKKLFLTVLIQALRDPMTQVNGFKVILDLNITLYTLRLFTPENLTQFFNGTEKCLPARIKAYHVINMGLAGRVLYNFVQLFLPEKLKKRVHIHKSIGELQDFFPRAVLPEEYGGDLKDYDMTEWLRKVTSPEELAVLNIMSS